MAEDVLEKRESRLLGDDGEPLPNEPEFAWRVITVT